jgi:hypothetical protein
MMRVSRRLEGGANWDIGVALGGVNGFYPRL